MYKVRATRLTMLGAVTVTRFCYHIGDQSWD